MSSADVRPSVCWLLMAQYGARPVIPLEQVIKDFFPHLDEKKFLRKTLDGDIKIPVVRIERSQKAARGILLTDLAAYLESRHQQAVKEMEQLNRGT